MEAQDILVRYAGYRDGLAKLLSSDGESSQNR
jgi:hypothetical protein